jgi:hypothetical protein
MATYRSKALSASGPITDDSSSEHAANTPAARIAATIDRLRFMVFLNGDKHPDRQWRETNINQR